jgi:hypothetical protein
MYGLWNGVHWTEGPLSVQCVISYFIYLKLTPEQDESRQPQISAVTSADKDGCAMKKRFLSKFGAPCEQGRGVAEELRHFFSLRRRSCQWQQRF